MLTDSYSKSHIGSGTQMYCEHAHTEVCYNPVELFYVWRQTRFFFFKCFSFNVKRHLRSKPDVGGWAPFSVRPYWLVAQLPLKLRSTKPVTWVAKYCKTDIVWKSNVLPKQKTNTPTSWGLVLKDETRVGTSFNFSPKKFFLSCKAKGARTAGAAAQAFVNRVFVPREWCNQTQRLYWFKLINPLIEDVDSAALQRLK